MDKLFTALTNLKDEMFENKIVCLNIKLAYSQEIGIFIECETDPDGLIKIANYLGAEIIANKYNIATVYKTDMPIINFKSYGLELRYFVKKRKARSK